MDLDAALGRGQNRLLVGEIIRAVSGGKIPVTKAPKTKAPEEQTAPQEPLNRSVANS